MAFPTSLAKRADVARMTVYHQFGSKLGLLEALCDSLAASGGMEQLATAFSLPEPFDALNCYILIFGRFWDEDRLVMHRLRALAALDPDFEQLMQETAGGAKESMFSPSALLSSRGFLPPRLTTRPVTFSVVQRNRKLLPMRPSTRSLMCSLR
jgi:AcrR family transcriptional regulator